MASSLTLPFSSTTTTGPLLFPKPHAKRSALRISCNAEERGKVDRRNMLLGLGGLGAATLVPTKEASADPINCNALTQAPELDKCGLSSYETKDKMNMEVMCCPPSGQKAFDYRLPPVTHMRIRPPAHRVSPEYIFKYNTAIDRMKRLPADDPRSFMQQANVHCAYCNGGYDQVGQGTTNLQVHGSWLFFPFHRWYLYFYERILGKLINDPTFALPFWNWDNPKGGMTVPPMFQVEKSAIYNSKRNQLHMSPLAIVDLVSDDLGHPDIQDPCQLVKNNLTVMYTEMIRGNNEVYDFMGQPYCEGTPDNPETQKNLSGASERGSHTAIHGWVGDPREPAFEDLGNFYSAGRDPLFYSHHANVDRMWMLWQEFSPIPVKNITNPDFLNSSFLFYDENADLVRVFVKDTIDHRRMGFDYERTDLPWLNYRPPRQSANAKILRKSSTAPKASTIFPLKLEEVVRFKVDKTKKGKADELLVLENIVVDTSKPLKFDVFVNDEDDNPNELNKAAYAGTFAQVPQKSKKKTATTSIRLKLTDLYDDMDVEDEDTVVVTIVPRHKGPGVTIGGIKIIEAPKQPSAATSS